MDRYINKTKTNVRLLAKAHNKYVDSPRRNEIKNNFFIKGREQTKYKIKFIPKKNGNKSLPTRVTNISMVLNDKDDSDNASCPILLKKIPLFMDTYKYNGGKR